MKPIARATTKNKDHINNITNTIRYKARWVIQGFNQKLGVDFLDTFSSTCRTETWHMLLIIAVNKGYYIWQYDVKNAFCNAKIDTDIYTKLPTGLYNSPIYQNKCAKLNKALYGLKQSPRLWNLHLKQVLETLGFRVLPYDEGIYINPKSGCILICHVDDILALHSSLEYIKSLKEKLNKHIELDEIGQVTTFLGNKITIDYQTKSLSISQLDYTNKLLKRFNINKENGYYLRELPFEPGVKLSKNPNQATDEAIQDYQKQIGSLLYLTLKTRPDITFSVTNCARFMANPSNIHFKILHKIWCYLLLYPDIGIIYNCSGNLNLYGYSDSDWANDINNRRSTTGYIYSLSSHLSVLNPISWSSQLQKTVALSTCEAEYIALKDSTKEAIYIYNIFIYINNTLNLGYSPQIPTILEDNESALKLAENPEYHKRSKHIDIQYHYTREALRNKKVKLAYIPSKDNIADILTKYVNKDVFVYLSSKIVSKID